jgi:prepilin-type N-terminal cleavage/methylation domain-containing protein
MFREVKAFTLIELLIVVAIIGILAAIAVPNFLEAQVRAKVAAVKSDMRNMAMALEAYNIDESSYPARNPEWYRNANPHKVTNHPTEPWVWFETIGDSFIPGQPDLPVDLLTTPIAYMSDLPIDPFQAGQEAEPELETGWYFYWYWPWGRYQGGSFKLLYPPSYWMLVSLGPDKYLYSMYHGPVLEYHRHAHYDSSNGTISLGDIARFGP